jgi:hypothetical protein
MLKDILKSGATALVSVLQKNGLVDSLKLGRASMKVVHRRAYDFDEKTGLFMYKDEDPELVWNVKTNAGIDFNHTQSYGTSPAGNGLNYIALSNDALTENAASTTLSSEIVANGLERAQGTVAHTPGATTTTVSKVFTATGAQAAQKAALFTASSAGTMHHALAFTQRTLATNDQLSLTFTITIS